MYKKVRKYMAEHPEYNSVVHVAIGLGIGILMTYPFVANPLRIGGTLVLLGIVGHLYPVFAKGK